MCELFGVSSSEKINVNTLLSTFFSHGVHHPHGWGLAFFYGDAVSLEKEAQAAHRSAYLKQRLRVNIEADQMMAHIRLATRGSLDYENTHPFVMRDYGGYTWTLAHNGTIFDCDLLNGYTRDQEGNTDSERILCHVVHTMNLATQKKGEPLAAQERFRLLDEMMAVISPENKINLLLFDGEFLYVHTNYPGSLHVCRKGPAAVFSTVPLDFDRWEPLPLNTLQAYRKGELIYTGRTHEGTFTDSEEKMRLLFLDFAGL